MYIIYYLGNNYIRGENMNKKRVRPILVPVIYCFCVCLFLFSMYFAQKLAKDILFNKNDKNLEYVDGEITDNNSNDIPVVSTSSKIVKPYLDESVTVAKSFYDYEGDATSQENSIIYYENTYMQNSGIDYASEKVFDVISILDGTVISVEQNDILGTTIEVRHSNDLISVYQSLSEVNVKKDDQIIQGQILAKSGTSNINKDLGNHLHFELYYKGKVVNPENYYDKSLEEL